jgi:TrmH family RNA methyltransferase
LSGILHLTSSIILRVTSRDNSLLRRTRAVRDGKLKELIFVEGLRLCEEALASGLKIDSVVFSEEIARKERAVAVLQELGRVCGQLAAVSEKLLASISFTKTPQGIILLASRPACDRAPFEHAQPAAPLIVVVHGVNNPVNVGAILRTAEAAGATGAIATAHTADPFSPKALRGAMGSAFRLRVWIGPTYQDVLTWCAQHDIATVCADVEALMAYTAIDWTRPTALLLGTESTGLTPAEISAATASVTIPMHGQVESLNVAVAAAVVLYEAVRQREARK